MPESNFQLDFATHSVHDWEKIARQELGNKDPWQNLTKEKSGLTIKPYYDARDHQDEIKINFPRDPWIENESLRLVNATKVFVADENKANKEALQHLNSGATAIFFDIQNQSVKPEVLLKKIELPYCSIFFSCEDESIAFLNSFVACVEKKSENAKVSGAFFWKEPLGKIDSTKFKHWINFKTAGIIIHEKENIVDEIVDALCTAVEFLDRLTKSGLTEEQAFQMLAFSISVRTDFFLSIAKIRALKNLWFTLQGAYSIKNTIAPFIHAYSPVWLNKEFQPHGNLLKQTTAGMAAALGGCNALTIEPEDHSNAMMSRIARNVSSILTEESHLSKVIDPLAGSFYIDSLTNQIASKTWAKFQKTV